VGEDGVAGSKVGSPLLGFNVLSLGVGVVRDNGDVGTRLIQAEGNVVDQASQVVIDREAGTATETHRLLEGLTNAGELVNVAGDNGFG
jgi:hypothetical protein